MLLSDIAKVPPNLAQLSIKNATVGTNLTVMMPQTATWSDEGRLLRTFNLRHPGLSYTCDPDFNVSQLDVATR